jgi:hypothetical protein
MPEVDILNCRDESATQPRSASQAWVFCAWCRPVGCGSRARISRRGARSSEELCCRYVSCGQDVSGDEIVLVLEQAGEREAGQRDPGCLGGIREVGALAVAALRAFAACARSHSAMVP